MLSPAPTRVGFWPERPAACVREPACAAPGVDQAFPSGRAAIAACLTRSHVNRQTVVAMPECVADCVSVAVRRCAVPVPLQAALSRQPGALVIYEQWGWPLPPAAVDHLLARLPGVPVIVDRVDSADFFQNRRMFGDFEVLSLSKVLGTAAGGIARQTSTGAYLPFGGTRRARPLEKPSHPAVRELFKQSQHVHPAVLDWLQHNCAERAAEAERLARVRAARTVLESPLAIGWPNWLAQSIAAGAGPVWAPVLRGGEPALHWRVVARLERDWGIAAAVRMFNWTGDPLAPRFEPCVALPIHSGVDGVGDVVSGLGSVA
jgi:hypothetical protein